MDFVEEYRIDAENSFIRFLITIENLCLSERISSMRYRSDTLLVGFVYRNWRLLRKPDAILVR